MPSTHPTVIVDRDGAAGIRIARVGGAPAYALGYAERRDAARAPTRRRSAASRTSRPPARSATWRWSGGPAPGAASGTAPSPCCARPSAWTGRGPPTTRAAGGPPSGSARWRRPPGTAGGRGCGPPRRFPPTRRPRRALRAPTGVAGRRLSFTALERARHLRPALPPRARAGPARPPRGHRGRHARRGGRAERLGRGGGRRPGAPRAGGARLGRFAAGPRLGRRRPRPRPGSRPRRPTATRAERMVAGLLAVGARRPHPVGAGPHGRGALRARGSTARSCRARSTCWPTRGEGGRW